MALLYYVSWVELASLSATSQTAATSRPCQQERLGGLTLLVCAHAKRDSRCGTLGTQLADCLVALIREQGLEEQVGEHRGLGVHPPLLCVLWQAARWDLEPLLSTGCC